MKKNIKRIVLILFTFIFLFLILVNFDFNEFIRVCKNFNLKYVVPLIFSIFISFSFRAICFKQLISPYIKNAKLSNLIALCTTGTALNIVLPARAGDIYRAYYVGDKYNVSKMKILGTVLFERIFDVLVIFSFLLIGIILYHRDALALKLCLSAGGLLVVSIITFVFLYKSKKTDKILMLVCEKIKLFTFLPLIQKCSEFLRKLSNSFLSGFEVIDYPKSLLYSILSSVGIWIFECINFLIIIYGFNCHIHWSVLLFIISFIALACMIPSASIYIGPYQLAVIAAFSLYGINKESALAMSLVEQFVVTIVSSIVAIVFLLKNNISLSELKENTEKTQL